MTPTMPPIHFSSPRATLKLNLLSPMMAWITSKTPRTRVP